MPSEAKRNDAVENSSKRCTSLLAGTRPRFLVYGETAHIRSPGRERDRVGGEGGGVRKITDADNSYSE